MPVEIVGAETLGKQLEDLYEVANINDMRAALNYAIDPVLQQARAMAPIGSKMFKTYKGRYVAPGFMQRSLFKKTTRSQDRTRAYAFVMLDKEAFYAKFVEQGYLTKNGRPIAARPFLRPAFLRNRGTMLDRYVDRLKVRIAKTKDKK